jgi:exoribonuclease R
VTVGEKGVPAPPLKHDVRRGRLVVPRVRLRDSTDVLSMALTAIKNALKLPRGFSPEVEAEASAAAAAVRLPDLDQTDIEFVTIDPEGSTDLDQALQFERAGSGYIVRYAIADVPAFVVPGGLVDTEARERGQTLYAPDGRIPLHPLAISEGAASLLEGQVRGAFVWTMQLDAAANVTSTGLRRARIRSRHRYSYVEVQQQLDAGTATESLQLLKEVGLKRIELERVRGGASLNRPDEEVVHENGKYSPVLRSELPVEGWNAQVSLMTGMAAAKIMLDGGVGILRTMPNPWPDTLERFRRQVAALGMPWPASQPYGEYLRSLDHNSPKGLAAIHAAVSLFRGAGYTAFDGMPPANATQAAVAAPYAHATAPLRRLVDRFVLVTCEALVAGTPVPQWARDALPTLPGIMARSDGIASRLEHSSVDAIEAALLAHRIGQIFDAVVIAVSFGQQGGGTANGAVGAGSGGVIQLMDPAVVAPIHGAVVAGQTVQATLVTADIATGTVLFRL